MANRAYSNIRNQPHEVQRKFWEWMDAGSPVDEIDPATLIQYETMKKTDDEKSLSTITMTALQYDLFKSFEERDQKINAIHEAFKTITERESEREVRLKSVETHTKTMATQLLSMTEQWGKLTNEQMKTTMLAESHSAVMANIQRGLNNTIQRLSKTKAFVIEQIKESDQCKYKLILHSIDPRQFTSADWTRSSHDDLKRSGQFNEELREYLFKQIQKAYDQWNNDECNIRDMITKVNLMLEGNAYRKERGLVKALIQFVTHSQRQNIQQCIQLMGPREAGMSATEYRTEEAAKNFHEKHQRTIILNDELAKSHPDIAKDHKMILLAGQPALTIRNKKRVMNEAGELHPFHDEILERRDKKNRNKNIYQKILDQSEDEDYPTDVHVRHPVVIEQSANVVEESMRLIYKNAVTSESDGEIRRLKNSEFNDKEKFKIQDDLRAVQNLPYSRAHPVLTEMGLPCGKESKTDKKIGVSQDLKSQIEQASTTLYGPPKQSLQILNKKIPVRNAENESEFDKQNPVELTSAPTTSTKRGPNSMSRLVPHGNVTTIVNNINENMDGNPDRVPGSGNESSSDHSGTNAPSIDKGSGLQKRTRRKKKTRKIRSTKANNIIKNNLQTNENNYTTSSYFFQGSELEGVGKQDETIQKNGNVPRSNEWLKTLVSKEAHFERVKKINTIVDECIGKNNYQNDDEWENQETEPSLTLGEVTNPGSSHSPVNPTNTPHTVVNEQTITNNQNTTNSLSQFEDDDSDMGLNPNLKLNPNTKKRTLSPQHPDETSMLKKENDKTKRRRGRPSGKTNLASTLTSSSTSTSNSSLVSVMSVSTPSVRRDIMARNLERDIDKNEVSIEMGGSSPGVHLRSRKISTTREITPQNSPREEDIQSPKDRVPDNPPTGTKPIPTSTKKSPIATVLSKTILQFTNRKNQQEESPVQKPIFNSGAASQTF